MNPEFDSTRQALEARLTAWLLGELDPDQARSLQEMVERDAELSRLHARLKQTIELVRATAVEHAGHPASATVPLKLSEQRRQELLQRFKTVTPKEFAQPKKRLMFKLSPVAAAVAAVGIVVGLLAALFLPTINAFKLASNISTTDASPAATAAPEPLALPTAGHSDLSVATDDLKPGSADPKPVAATPAPPIVHTAIVLPAETPPPVALVPPASESVNFGALVRGVSGGREEADKALPELGGPNVVHDIKHRGAVQELARQSGRDYAFEPSAEFNRIAPDGKAVPEPTVSLGDNAARRPAQDAHPNLTVEDLKKTSAGRIVPGQSAGAPGGVGGGAGGGVVHFANAPTKTEPALKPNDAETARRRFSVSPSSSPAPSKPTQSASKGQPQVQDGRALFEMGRFNEAEAAFKSAIKEDPNNNQAHYYLDQLKDAQSKNQVASRENSAGNTLVQVEQAWAAPSKRGELAWNGRGVTNSVRGFYDDSLNMSTLERRSKELEARVEPTTGLPLVGGKVVTGAGAVDSSVDSSGVAHPSDRIQLQAGDFVTADKERWYRQEQKLGEQLDRPGEVKTDFFSEKVPVLGGVPMAGDLFLADGTEQARGRLDVPQTPPVTTWGAIISGGEAQVNLESADLNNKGKQPLDGGSNRYDPITHNRMLSQLGVDDKGAGRPVVTGSLIPEGKATVDEGVRTGITREEAASIRSLSGYSDSDPAAATRGGGQTAHQVAPSNISGYGDVTKRGSNIVLPGTKAESQVTRYAKGEDISLALGRLATPAETPAPAASSSTAEQLAEKQRQLEELQRGRQMLYLKIASEKIDTALPKSSMVSFVDRATPPTKSPSLWDKLTGSRPTAVARIRIDRDESDIAELGGRKNNAGAYDPYFIQTETEVLKSELVLGKVVDAMNLQEVWGKKDGKPVKKSEAINLLKKKLDLEPVKNTQLMEIRVKAENPVESATLANKIAEAYRDYRVEQQKKLSMGGITALKEQFGEQEQKVRKAQQEVDALRTQLRGSEVALNRDTPAALLSADTLRRVDDLLIKGKADYQSEKATLEKLQKLPPDQLVQALPSTAPDSLLSSLADQLSVAEQKLAQVKKDNGPTSAETQKATQQVDDLRDKLKKRADGIMVGLSARVAALGEKLQILEAEVRSAQSNDIAKASATALKQDTDEPPKARPAVPPPIPQPEIVTRENAWSTFSLNVSDVSFKLAGASLEKGQLPDPASIRSEEFVNAFDYRDPEPPAGVPVAFAWERAQYPFAQNRDLLRFSLKTAAQGRQPGRPLNIILLLDNSGSMERADRVQIIREALKVLAAQLQPQDKFSLITFARTPRLLVDGIAGNQAAPVADEVGGLTPQGGTNLEEAMNLAYETAARHYLPNGINRVVLLTDGAANLGDVEPESLKQKVEAQRKQGIALDCFGIGWEGFNDDLLEVMSRNGDGRYGFINTPGEAATEFAGQLAGALQFDASDVKVQVEFNPTRVTAYRQIGYAKHQLTKEQFRDNTVDAAEIGAAESGNALYTIEVNPAGEGPLATVRARYKVPGTSDYREQEWVVPYAGAASGLAQSSSAMRLAASASAFSEWLATNPYAGEVSPDQLLAYLSGVPEVYGADVRPKKLEWMIRQAKSLAGK